MDNNTIYNENCLSGLKKLPNESVDCVFTSPPYWALRDYGVDGQLGIEPNFQEYINKLCDIFDEVKRVLKPTGTCWVNLGDTYGGNSKGGNKVFGNPEFNKNCPSRELTKTPDKRCELPGKCLVQIPSRFAIEMTNRGWILRNEIIWYKRNCMPSSAKDRFTVDFEKVFMFSKQKNYYFEQQKEPLAESSLKARGAKLNQTKNSGANKSAVNVQLGNESRGNIFVPEGGRNMRCVWDITTKSFKEAHYAVFPEKLAERVIKAGCPEGGVVLDPFFGSGTVGVVALKNGRKYLGFELNKEYIEIAEKRIRPHKEQERLKF